MCLMLKRVLGAVAVCLALSFLAAPDAQAEGADFQRAIHAAISDFEAGRFEQARRHFAEAHALSPSARTLRALGMVEFELHRFVECVTYLEQALSARVKPLDEALRREAQGVLARAKRETARVRFTLAPAEAQLTIDGAPGLPGADHTLTLLPGSHVAEIHAPGRSSEQLTLSLSAGEQREVSVVLPPLPAASATHEDRPARALYKNPWLWSGVGVVAVGLITGLSVGFAVKDGTRSAAAYGGDTNAVLSGP